MVDRLGKAHLGNPACVLGVKHSPPGPPVLAEMFKGHKNTVLLTWKPPEPAPETPFIYRLERQEVGSEDWIQCFSIEKAGAVEVPGDCVPSEGDYRFRVCTVSEHGRSPHVVFHGSAHLGESYLPHSSWPLGTSTPFWPLLLCLCCPQSLHSGSDGCPVSLPQCPQLAWWQVWRMCRYMMGKMPSSPWTSPPSSRAPGS